MIKNKNILIVEDDLLQALFLKKCIRYLDHQVIGSTNNGDTAIELAIEYAPDIILMDIALGEKCNGIETARSILNVTECFIFFITGIMNPDLLTQARQIPSSFLSSKPIKVETLQKVIEDHYKSRASAFL